MGAKQPVIVAVAFGFLIGGLALYRSLSDSSSEEPASIDDSTPPGARLEPLPRMAQPPPPVDPSVTARGAEKVQIEHLIGIIRTASVKGDSATRDAAIEGLRRHGEPAILALHEHMTRETNPRVIDSLSEAIRRIDS